MVLPQIANNVMNKNRIKKIMIIYYGSINFTVKNTDNCGRNALFINMMRHAIDLD